jgi:septum site-determining protein MinC
MTTSSLIKDNQACFQFRASFSPCTILQMTRYDLEALEQQLADAIRRAPNFFLGSPVIIDLEKIQELKEIDFNKIKQILIAAGMVPMGMRGGSPEQTIAAVTAGLPMVTIGKSSTEINKKVENDTKKSDEPVHTTKLVTNPIRSGMQLYAKDGDLIVVAQVSPGAELLADGHIHVYGTLRGRALAGVQGNTNARIFCRTLEAELVSIAGYYLTKEDIQTLPTHDGMIQIYLENEQVRIEVV